MIKKLLVSSVLILSLIFPITKAFAVLPLIYLGYAAAAGSQLTPWIAGSTALVGTAIAIFNFNKQQTATAASPAIQITLDPNVPLITPPQWTAAPTGQQEPVPPAVKNQASPFSVSNTTQILKIGGFTNFDPITAPTITALVSQIQTRSVGQNGVCAVSEEKTCTVTYNEQTQNIDIVIKEAGFQDIVHIINVDPATCDPGYFYDGDPSGSCALMDATQVQKPSDHICEMVKSTAGTFTPSPNDPDCANATIAGKSTAKLEYTVSETEHLIIQNDNSGKVTITQKAYNASENKTSAYTATLSTARVVTSTTTTNATGNTLSDTGTGTGTGTGGTSGETTVVNFPNDYSKTGEAQTAANSIIQKLDSLTSTTGAADGSATDPTFSDGFGETFNALTAWQLPLHTSTCPTASFNVWNHQFNLDAQCNVFNDVKAPLSFAMVTAWVILALFIVLGA